MSTRQGLGRIMGQLDRGLGWAVPWEGARVYGARAWEGTKNLVEYKSLEGDRDLGVGWAA